MSDSVNTNGLEGHQQIAIEEKKKKYKRIAAEKSEASLE